MNKNEIKTIGFSLIRQDGPFSIELDWIKGVNTENTLGDFDILEEGTYIDDEGMLRQTKNTQVDKNII